jgi:hypothetical protein
MKRLLAKTDANNEKFDVLRCTSILLSGMDIHQARTESTQEEMSDKMDIHPEKTVTAIKSIRSELEETIKHRVEDVLSCVDQKAQGLRKGLTKKTDETQVDLQAVKTTLETRMKNLQETLVDTRNDIHEELGLMLQVEAQRMKAEIRINQERAEAKAEAIRREFQTQVKEVEAGKEKRNLHGSGEATEVRQDYIIGRVPVPVPDRSRAQLLDETGKIHILDHGPQGRATDVLNGVPKGSTDDEFLETGQDRFGDQHLPPPPFCGRLITRTQIVGESLQELATAVEQLAHSVYPSLP